MNNNSKKSWYMKGLFSLRATYLFQNAVLACMQNTYRLGAILIFGASVHTMGPQLKKKSRFHDSLLFQNHMGSMEAIILPGKQS